jgi:hypothetical protein
VLTAEQVWWERIRRCAEREGLAGSKAMSDWVLDWLAVIFGHTEEGRGAGDPDYIVREQRRVNDELGARFGVGPMPD